LYCGAIVMQQHPLLQTKLYVPRIRRELVSRPRLIERLNAGLNGCLTLVSAPAGYGKTTLVTQWLNSTKCPSTWLSLDESDNDPTRFLAYFVAALRTVDADIGKGALSALQSPQPPPSEAVLTSLINDVAAIPDRILLVLDDYHLIESSPVDNALTFLLEHLPAQMHLVIATRDDPHLSLARLRARGHLTELRAADLRFAASEAADFLNQVMGLELAAEDIAVLERRTEGWIAGLQLAAISMQGREDTDGLIQSFAGSHRYVLDYLVEEVLEQQSESVQAFLLQTAILDRMTGPLCDAVCFGFAETQSSSGGTGVRFGAAESPSTPEGDAVRSGLTESPTDQDIGQATLEMLERANLFIIPLDSERHWYRYHHLFSDLLRQRLRRVHPEWIPTLYHRASEWYEQNGFADEAIEHALRAKSFERAAYLLEERADVLWGRGEHGKLSSWLVKFPADLIYSRPHLSIFHAWYLFASGDQDAAERYLQTAERALDPSIGRAAEALPEDRQDHLSDIDRMKLWGKAAAIRAFMDSYRGDVSGIIQHARQALECLPEQDLPMRSLAAIALGDAHSIKGEMTAAYQARLEATQVCRSIDNTFYLIAANLKLAMTLRALGQLQRTVEVCQQQLELAETSGLSQVALVGLSFAIWGEVLAELDDLDRAIDRAQRGVELTEPEGDLAIIGWSYQCLMRVLFSRGDTTGAEVVVKKVETIARESDVPLWFTNNVAAWQTRIWLARNELEAADQWAKQPRLDTDGELNPLHELGFLSLVEFTVLARVLIAQERSDEATRLLSRLLEAVEAGEHTSGMVEILMLQALAFQAGGDTDQAVSALERALALAEPGGFIRTFVDEGPPMARLLYEAVARGIAPAYARRLLAAFPAAAPERADQGETQTPESGLVEPLSDRELEVLELIAEGLTNPEIAARLYLALNTVKSHTRSIYGKLGVNNRTRAASRARALGIVPPI
jgi:LuxR family maltose regulon positive regulatory protein